MQKAKPSLLVDIDEAGRILGYTERHARRILEEHLTPWAQTRANEGEESGSGKYRAFRWFRSQVEALAKQLTAAEKPRTKNQPAKLLGNRRRSKSA